MNRFRFFFFVCLALTLATGNASADMSPAAESTRVIHGYFDCDGSKMSFSLPEGRGLTLSRKDGSASYRLVAERLDNQRASLVLVDAESGQRVERFDAALDGRVLRGSNTPLSLALTGITVERTLRRQIDSATAASETGGPSTDNSCCITCGGWIVCCEPSSGWCCGLQCSSGGSCSACTPSEQ